MPLMERRRNEDTRKKMHVLCITDQIRKNILRSFGHVVRRYEDKANKKA